MGDRIGLLEDIMKKPLVLAFILTVFFWISGSATIINVPDDYDTIQLGINASSEHDTVLVHPGIYHENLVIEGHCLTLASDFMMTGDSSCIHNTVIDGDSLDTVVSIHGWNAPPSTICGFTVAHGASVYRGGGVYVENASVICNNIIESNSSSRGGGIHSVGSSVIADNVIRNNHVTVAGGGIITYGGSFTVERNIICRNTSEAYGGGIHIEDSQYVIIRDNIITGNHSSSHGGGVVFYTYDQGGRLAGNLIAGNITDNGFGVEFCPGEYEIGNNTICNNEGSDYGIIFEEYSTANLVNNIIWDYTDQQILVDQSATVTVSYCDVRGGFEGTGNIDSYPTFVDTANCDYHLQAGSPCIDAGDPDWPHDPDGTIADIGAFYFDQLVGIVGDESESPVISIRLSSYPNPFNASTTILYDLPASCNVSVDIYDMLGRRIETLAQGRMDAGPHQATWNAMDRSSGLYFCRLKAGQYSETGRMLLLR
jgi:hypothetical protein